MTDQNNAAQAAGKILTYLGFTQAMGMEPGVDHRRDHIQSLIESTLPSKLRAEGVPAGESVNPHIGYPDLADAWQRGFDGRTPGWSGLPHDVFHASYQEGKRARAALASAPVAGNARPDIMSLSGILAEYRKGCSNTGGEGPENCPDCVRAFVSALEALNVRQASAPVADAESQPTALCDEVVSKAWINVSDSYGIAYNGPSYADAAPQASAEPLARYCPGCGSVGPVGDEYRDCCPDGNQARMIPERLAEQCRDTFRLAIQSLLPDAPANDGAAPQASEAVRILFPAHLRKMWPGGEVQAWLDNYQGVTPPIASAKGSLERYRNWRVEQAEADKDGVRSKGRQ